MDRAPGSKENLEPEKDLERGLSICTCHIHYTVYTIQYTVRIDRFRWNYNTNVKLYICNKMVQNDQHLVTKSDIKKLFKILKLYIN